MNRKKRQLSKEKRKILKERLARRKDFFKLCKEIGPLPNIPLIVPCEDKKDEVKEDDIK